MKKLKYDPLNIVICGIGGQGNVLASEVLGSAMTDLGYHVAIGETYGASQRGGSVMSHVRISEEHELGVLISAGEAHFIIGFEPLETLRMVRRYAGPGTRVIYDPRPVYPQGVLHGTQKYPDLDDLVREIRACCAEATQIPAADIAMDCGDSRAANIALLGAFSCLPGAPLNEETLAEILGQRFKGAVLEMNRKVFAKGCEVLKGQLAEVSAGPERALDGSGKEADGPAAAEPGDRTDLSKKPEDMADLSNIPEKKQEKTLKIRFLYPETASELELDLPADTKFEALTEILYARNFVKPQKPGYAYLIAGHLCGSGCLLSDYLAPGADSLTIRVFGMPHVLV